MNEIRKLQLNVWSSHHHLDSTNIQLVCAQYDIIIQDRMVRNGESEKCCCFLGQIVLCILKLNFSFIGERFFFFFLFFILSFVVLGKKYLDVRILFFSFHMPHSILLGIRMTIYSSWLHTRLCNNIITFKINLVKLKNMTIVRRLHYL